MADEGEKLDLDKIDPYKAAILQQITHLIEKAAELWGEEQTQYLAHNIAVSFGLRGLTAGAATMDPENPKMRFNLDLARENIEEFLKSTVPHEFAHLLVMYVVPPRADGKRIMPHGKEWRQIMYRLGYAAHIYHRYDAKPTRPQRLFLYECDCPDRKHTLGIVKHNKHQGTMTNRKKAAIAQKLRESGIRFGYQCQICAARIRFIKELDPE